jgi:hypothetical protein
LSSGFSFADFAGAPRRRGAEDSVVETSAGQVEIAYADY